MTVHRTEIYLALPAPTHVDMGMRADGSAREGGPEDADEGG
jgi:hypothetical protein